MFSDGGCGLKMMNVIFTKAYQTLVFDFLKVTYLNEL